MAVVAALVLKWTWGLTKRLWRARTRRTSRRCASSTLRRWRSCWCKRDARREEACGGYTDASKTTRARPSLLGATARDNSARAEHSAGSYDEGQNAESTLDNPSIA